MFEEMTKIHIPEINKVMAVENTEPILFEKTIYDFITIGKRIPTIKII